MAKYKKDVFAKQNVWRTDTNVNQTKHYVLQSIGLVTLKK